MYKPGDPVIYRLQKQSTHPGPRAQDIDPATSGETYSYFVEKFWVVAELHAGGGKLLLRTRRGKEHLVDANDPHLRPARWWERLIHRKRFPAAGNEQ